MVECHFISQEHVLSAMEGQAKALRTDLRCCSSPAPPTSAGRVGETLGGSRSHSTTAGGLRHSCCIACPLSKWVHDGGGRCCKRGSNTIGPMVHRTAFITAASWGCRDAAKARKGKKARDPRGGVAPCLRTEKQFCAHGCTHTAFVPLVVCA